MITARPCILYTQDADWRRRVTSYLQSLETVQQAATPAELQKLLTPLHPALVLLDLRAEKCRDLLPRIRKTRPQHVIIAFGVPRSDPMREAEALGTYAAEDLLADRHRLKTLVSHALDHLHLQVENETLKYQALQGSPTPSPAPQPEALPRGRTADSRLLSSTFRPLHDVDSLLQRAVEHVATATMAMRVGIFAQDRPGQPYRLRAWRHASPAVCSLSFPEDHPLVCWLAARAQMISRATLEHLPPAPGATSLEQCLDDFGAEIIVPILGSTQLLGWVFVGPRATGFPFTSLDLEEVLFLTDPIAAALEQALNREESSAQIGLVEILLHSLSTGIVAIETSGKIRWFNDAARAVLGLSREELSDAKVEVLGTHLADTLRRTLEGPNPEEISEWTDPTTKRTLAVHTRRLLDDEECVGAVVLIQDVTVGSIPEGEEEEETDQATFWSELAASMSHEIRNPLVAIKTFSQLLPERYADEEFRTDFTKLVTQEVDRLDGVVDQINELAHPPELQFKPLDIHSTVQKGLNLALIRHPKDGIKFQITMDDHLPPVRGDDEMLSECFAHIVSNAMEAVSNSVTPQITLSAHHKADLGPGGAVMITIRDNGAGIPKGILPRVFSPFCTTKARGMGLGLPIVKRTVAGHNGRVHIDTDEKGTALSIVLPACEKEDGP